MKFVGNLMECSSCGGVHRVLWSDTCFGCVAVLFEGVTLKRMIDSTRVRKEMNNGSKRTVRSSN